MLTKRSEHQLYGDEIILRMERAEPEHVYAVWPDNTVCDLEEVWQYNYMSDDYLVVHSSLPLEEFEESLYDT